MERPSSAISAMARDIRNLTKQIKAYTRDKKRVAVEDEEGNEIVVDPVPELEEKRHLMLQKYELLNDGREYKLTPEDKIVDFYEEFYRELQRKDRDVDWLRKFYHPDANMTWIEGVTQTKFLSRTAIIDSYLKRYDSLRVHHLVREVKVDKATTVVGAVFGATVTVMVQIEDDAPRQVKLMVEWVRAVESGLFDIMIMKEFFWVADARPLYHWPEKLLPYEERLIQEREEAKKRKEMEELQAQLRGQEEESQLEDSQEGDEDDEDEEDEDDNEEGDEDGVLNGERIEETEIVGTAEDKIDASERS